MHGQRTGTTRGKAEPQLAPYNREIEEAVLGSLILDPSALALVRGKLDSDDFWVTSYGAAYQGMIDMVEAGQHVDVLTLSEYLEGKGYGEGVAGGLLQFVTNTPTSVHVVSYAGIIKDLAMRRRLIDLGGHIAGNAYDEDQDIDDVLNDTLSKVVGVVKHKTGLLADTKSVVKRAVERMVWRQDHPGELWGMSTSLLGLDKLMDGFPPGLTVLSGITKHGKTALALQVASHHAKQGKHIVMFALEMTAESLVERIACARAGVDRGKMKRGQLDKAEQQRIYMAYTAIENEPWHLVYKASISAAEIYSEVARLAMQGQCDLVVVDYIQLMDHGRAEREDLRIANTTKTLHNLGIEFNVPVLGLAQFNRGVHSRDDEIPHLSDLKGSGSIEQDAALVMFIHRPEMIYEAALKECPPEWENVALLIVAANREGETGVHKCVWRGAYQQFADMARGL